ncbi:MAG: hypothetical protein HFJ52_07130 [Clostridia bacterium]|jgi:hypothetical protein|nr:hypothetical protein [Clostridia bacterium]
MKKLKEEIKEIVNHTIKENNWDSLVSKKYGEFFTPTELSIHIIFNDKKITGTEVNDILEELHFFERVDEKIILTEEGKEYGRYAIAIHLSDNKPIITDKGYAKYRMEVVDIINQFISENPQFLIKKREERNQKKKETREKNKKLKEENKEELANGKEE